MSFSLTNRFFANARAVAFKDANGITWSFNANTNEVAAAYTGAGSAGAANPTAKVGLTVVNGSAATFMRSDASPPVDQAMSPTWTGTHTFTKPLLVGAAGLLGVLGVLTADANVGAGVSTWGSSKFVLVGPNVASSSGAALALGYDATLAGAAILSLAPGVAWKPLKLYCSSLGVFGASGVESITFSAAPATGSATATFTAANKPGSTSAPAKWLPVTYSGATYYIPLWT